MAACLPILTWNHGSVHGVYPGGTLHKFSSVCSAIYFNNGYDGLGTCTGNFNTDFCGVTMFLPVTGTSINLGLGDEIPIEVTIPETDVTTIGPGLFAARVDIAFGIFSQANAGAVHLIIDPSGTVKLADLTLDATATYTPDVRRIDGLVTLDASVTFGTTLLRKTFGRVSYDVETSYGLTTQLITNGELMGSTLSVSAVLATSDGGNLSIGTINPYYKFTLADGTPAANGYIVTYAAGTSTLQSTYSDNALTSANANSQTLANTLRLDSDGGALMYLAALNYKFDVFDATQTRLTGYPVDAIAGSLWPGLIAATGTLTPSANANASLHQFGGTFNKAASGTHALFAGSYMGVPTINAGAAVLSEATTHYIAGAPSVGTNQYAQHVASGAVKFDGPLLNVVEAGSSSGNALTAYGTSTITCSTGGGTTAYTMGGPVAGRSKNIACITGSTSSGTATVTISSGTYNASGTIATFSTAGYLNLVASTNAMWSIVGSANVTIT